MTAPSVETLAIYLQQSERLLADHERILKKRGRRDVAAHTLMDDALRLGHIGRLLSMAQRLAQNDPGRAVTPEMAAEAAAVQARQRAMLAKLRFLLVNVRPRLGMPTHDGASLAQLVDETFETVRALTVSGEQMSPAEAHALTDHQLAVAAHLQVFGQAVDLEVAWRRHRARAAARKEPIPPHPALPKAAL